MDIISLYEDVARDNVNSDENGYLGYTMFNRLIQRASNRTLDYITGDSSLQTLPISYSTQKAKDFISFLITKYSALITNGVIQKPADYYTYENLVILSVDGNTECDEDTDCDEDTPTPQIIRTPVEMLDGQQFDVRCNTWTKSKKPSAQYPISKVVGNTIEFEPKELGSCTLEYIRYPIAGEIVSSVDPVFYNDVADPALSTDSEWPEWAREFLIFFSSDTYSNHTREQALKQFNMASKPKPTMP